MESDSDYVERLDEAHGGALMFGGVTGGASPAQAVAPVPLRFAVWPEKPRTRTSECRDRLTMADACALHGTVLFPVGRTRRDIPKSWLH